MRAYRRPRTAQERRRNDRHDEAVFVRPARRPANVPTSWDELLRSDQPWRTHRSWKLLRRTQHKAL